MGLCLSASTHQVVPNDYSDISQTDNRLILKTMIKKQSNENINIYSNVTNKDHINSALSDHQSLEEYEEHLIRFINDVRIEVNVSDDNTITDPTLLVVYSLKNNNSSKSNIQTTNDINNKNIIEVLDVIFRNAIRSNLTLYNNMDSIIIESIDVIILILNKKLDSNLLNDKLNIENCLAILDLLVMSVHNYFLSETLSLIRFPSNIDKLISLIHRFSLFIDHTSTNKTKLLLVQFISRLCYMIMFILLPIKISISSYSVHNNQIDHVVDKVNIIIQWLNGLSSTVFISKTFNIEFHHVISLIYWCTISSLIFTLELLYNTKTSSHILIQLKSDYFNITNKIIHMLSVTSPSSNDLSIEIDRFYNKNSNIFNTPLKSNIFLSSIISNKYKLNPSNGVYKSLITYNWPSSRLRYVLTGLFTLLQAGNMISENNNVTLIQRNDWVVSISEAINKSLNIVPFTISNYVNESRNSSTQSQSASAVVISAYLLSILIDLFQDFDDFGLYDNVIIEFDQKLRAIFELLRRVKKNKNAYIRRTNSNFTSPIRRVSSTYTSALGSQSSVVSSVLDYNLDGINISEFNRQSKQLPNLNLPSSKAMMDILEKSTERSMDMSTSSKFDKQIEKNVEKSFRSIDNNIHSPFYLISDKIDGLVKLPNDKIRWYPGIIIGMTANHGKSYRYTVQYVDGDIEKDKSENEIRKTKQRNNNLFDQMIIRSTSNYINSNINHILTTSNDTLEYSTNSTNANSVIMSRIDSTITTANINILNKALDINTSNPLIDNYDDNNSPRSVNSEISLDNSLVFTIPSVFEGSNVSNVNTIQRDNQGKSHLVPRVMLSSIEKTSSINITNISLSSALLPDKVNDNEEDDEEHEGYIISHDENITNAQSNVPFAINQLPLRIPLLLHNNSSMAADLSSGRTSREDASGNTNRLTWREDSNPSSIRRLASNEVNQSNQIPNPFLSNRIKSNRGFSPLITNESLEEININFEDNILNLWLKPCNNIIILLLHRCIYRSSILDYSTYLSKQSTTSNMSTSRSYSPNNSLLPKLNRNISTASTSIVPHQINFLYTIREYLDYLQLTYQSSFLFEEQNILPTNNLTRSPSTTISKYPSNIQSSPLINSPSTYLSILLSNNPIGYLIEYSSLYNHSMLKILKLLTPLLFQNCLTSHIDSNTLSYKIGQGGFGTVHCVTCPSTCRLRMYHFKGNYQLCRTVYKKDNQLEGVDYTVLNEVDHKYAIKRIIRENNIHDIATIYDIYNEITSLELLSSNLGVCTLFDYGIYNNEYWLILEYGGLDINQWRKLLINQSTNQLTFPYSNSKLSYDILNDQDVLTKELSLDNIIYCIMIYLESLLILKSIHLLDIAHFDIKCNNFMLRSKYLSIDHMVKSYRSDKPSGAVFLSDFGESIPNFKQSFNLSNGEITPDTSHIKLRCRGTLAIQSPEQLCMSNNSNSPSNANINSSTNSNYKSSKIKFNLPDSRSDIWSIGAMFNEIITGHYLFEGYEWSNLYVINCKDGYSCNNLPLDMLRSGLKVLSDYNISKCINIIYSSMQQLPMERSSIDNMITETKSLLFDLLDVYSNNKSTTYSIVDSNSYVSTDNEPNNNSSNNLHQLNKQLSKKVEDGMKFMYKLPKTLSMKSMNSSNSKKSNVLTNYFNNYLVENPISSSVNINLSNCLKLRPQLLDFNNNVYLYIKPFIDNLENSGRDDIFGLTRFDVNSYMKLIDNNLEFNSIDKVVISYRNKVLNKLYNSNNYVNITLDSNVDSKIDKKYVNIDGKLDNILDSISSSYYLAASNNNYNMNNTQIDNVIDGSNDLIDGTLIIKTVKKIIIQCIHNLHLGKSIIISIIPISKENTNNQSGNEEVLDYEYYIVQLTIQIFIINYLCSYIKYLYQYNNDINNQIDANIYNDSMKNIYESMKMKYKHISNNQLNNVMNYYNDININVNKIAPWLFQQCNPQLYDLLDGNI